MKRPLITIGIPIYNVEKYVEEALLSALNQSYPNIEILVVDDRGKDSSMQLVRNLSQNHPRGKEIKIFTHTENQGLSCARNTIIEHAEGEYLYFMDSDDYITTDCIEIMYNVMQTTPADLVEASYDMISQDGLQTLEICKHKKSYQQDEECLYNYRYRYSLSNEEALTLSAWNKLLRLSFLKENQIQFIPHTYYEDRPFTLLLSLKGKSCHLLPDITYHYRQRKDSIMHSGIEKYSKKEIQDFVYQANWRKNAAFQHKKEKYAELIIQEVMTEALYPAHYYLKRKQYIEVDEIRPYIQQLISYPYSIGDYKYFNKYKRYHIKYWFFSKLPYCLQAYYLKRLK